MRDDQLTTNGDQDEGFNIETDLEQSKWENVFKLAEDYRVATTTESPKAERSIIHFDAYEVGSVLYHHDQQNSTRFSLEMTVTDSNLEISRFYTPTAGQIGNIRFSMQYGLQSHPIMTESKTLPVEENETEIRELFMKSLAAGYKRGTKLPFIDHREYEIIDFRPISPTDFFSEQLLYLALADPEYVTYIEASGSPLTIPMEIRHMLTVKKRSMTVSGNTNTTYEIYKGIREIKLLDGV